MKKLGIIKTDDGSSTLFNNILQEHYHSTFGAIQESQHVFIDCGLGVVPKSSKLLSILEIGFGTGLNALLSLQWAEQNKQKIDYFGIEAYPIEIESAKLLNYPDILKVDDQLFIAMHDAFDKKVILTDHFQLKVNHQFLSDARLPDNHFDLVYFDAFSPDVQPEMWTDTVFCKIAASLKVGGVITTYSTKGIVKRALKSAGFVIEKLPGPPGKREILRGVLSK